MPRHSEQTPTDLPAAAGIAHDLNNILLATTITAQHAADHLPPHHPAQNNLQTILTNLRHAAELTTLLHPNPPTDHHTPICLRTLIEESIPIATTCTQAPPTIDITLDAGPATPTVRANKPLLRQAILNLLINALEALENQGSIHIRLHAVHSPTTHIIVQITDSGPGIPQPSHLHIFNPNFTTKPHNTHTRGLGLAVVAQAVRAHLGTITLTSAPGQGSTFTITLPALVQPDTTIETKPNPPRPHPDTISVMVIEDDPLIRRLITINLSTLGIHTHPFPTGQEALDALRANPTTYNAAIIDQNMPGMTGLQTLAALRQLQPDLPIILTSGYPLSLLPNPLPQATFLHKPYTMTQLQQALTKAINLHAPTA
ncbi:MAG: ATP-binding protein [bacterium]